MAEEGDSEDRTEAASARRLQSAREEGHVPLSREVPAVAGLAAAALALTMAAPASVQRAAPVLAGFLEHLGQIDPLSPDVLHAALIAAGRLAMPFVLAVLAAGVAATLLQTGFLFTPAALRVDPGRLSPLAGFRRLFGPDNGFEALKSLLKLGVLGFVVWRVLVAGAPSLPGMLTRGPAALLDAATRWILHAVLALLVAQGAIAVLDLLWVRLRHARQLRMSRQELREEAKETEGNPHVKARLRQIRHLRARKRMLAAVPKAAVVVTNPTHYAVALAYERGRGAAPRVVAKGVDSMAARIRAVAEENRVPLVANPPLARALYRVELDAEIPPEHYKAVAGIIAYVWRLDRRVGGARRGG
jgi:flagellar biosynthetic protein FlhB